MSKPTETTTETPDSLEPILAHVAQGTEFHFESGLCGIWTLIDKRVGCAAIHIVTQGECWFGTLHQAKAPQIMSAGDLVFVNQDVEHYLSVEPIPQTIEPEDITKYCEPEHQQQGIVCYDIKSQSEVSQAVLAMLPDTLIMRTSEQVDALRQMIQTLALESRSNSPGKQILIQRLSDVVTLYLLREIVARGTDLHGPLSGLSDRQMKPLLLAMIHEPEADWSVEEMAKRAFLSPSAFAERCVKQIGIPPKKLLDQIRLHTAKALLRRHTLSLEQVAAKTGYQSVTAFSRFFKKYTGCSASEYRTSN